MELTRLFSPIKIGKNLELKNRIIMAAIHHLYTQDGYATDRFNDYYWRRAEGGVGMIIVGGVRFDDYGGPRSMISLQTDEYIHGYRKFTEGVHRMGAKVGAQLFHAGAYARMDDIGGRAPLAPSAIYCRYSRTTPKEISKKEITELVDNWSAAAARAREAGFDMVELISSAGYLISQFLSPVTNIRTDEYGGSWENRIRFPLEVIEAVRKAVGADYPIGIRIGGNDFISGSNANETAVEFCRIIESAGIDFFNVTGGWHESRVPQITGDLPRGGFAYLAMAIKDAVGIPVAASNRINDPIVAERILALEQADVISLGRPLIADPEWPEKARSGRFDEIKHCIACNQGCLSKAFFSKPVECLVNSEAGREYEIKKTKSQEKKRILVVGAGPAGCEFAIAAAKHGHKVTIWEKTGRVGGQLHMAALPPGKSEFLSLIKYYNAQIKKNSIDLILNKQATANEIAAYDCDMIVTATGMTPVEIPLKNPCCMPVVTAYDVLKKSFLAGRNVVVVGGGTVGCETARYLAHEATLSAEQFSFLLDYNAETFEKVSNMRNKTRRTIFIIDIAEIGKGFDPGTSWTVLQDLNRFDVRMYSFSTIEEAGANTIRITANDAKNNETRSYSLPCDTIVLAVGAKPNDTLFRELSAMGKSVYNLGDSCKIGNAMDAVKAANDLAMKIK